MRKGMRLGPGLLRLMIALFALAVLTVVAVVVKELPAQRRKRTRKSM